jgi:Ser/Thr protein kinase RdoA (MazF antagonist)
MGRVHEGLLNDLERVGDAVHRRARVPMDRSFGEAVLVRLAAAGFDAAPRFLGRDAEGRQVLSWVEGEVRPLVPGAFDDDLALVLQRVRRFHELSPGVCHNDLAPRNTVWTSAGPVFIDWDLCAPGRPIEDVAHVCWQFLGLGPLRDDDIGDVRVALAGGVDAYGLDAAGRSILVDEIAAWQRRCADGIEERAAKGEAPFRTLIEFGAVTEIRAAREWLLDRRADLEVSVGR